jgi:hypothetical protein
MMRQCHITNTDDEPGSRGHVCRTSSATAGDRHSPGSSGGGRAHGVDVLVEDEVPMTTEPHGWDETDAPEAVGDALAGLGWTVAGLESAVERLQRAGRRVTQVLILGAGAQLVGSAALLIVWLLWRGARECIERPGWGRRAVRALPTPGGDGHLPGVS